MTIAGATKVRMEVRMVNTAVKTDRESTYIAPHIKKLSLSHLYFIIVTRFALTF